MIRFLVLLVTSAWLLLPPGMCLCHVHEASVPEVQKSIPQNSEQNDLASTSDNDAPEHDHHEDDHVPSCPSQKHWAGQCVSPEIVSGDYPPVFVLWLGERPIQQITSCLSHLQFHDWNIPPPAQPIYITTRKLVL